MEHWLEIGLTGQSIKAQFYYSGSCHEIFLGYISEF